MRYDDFQLTTDSTSEKVIRLLHKFNIPVVLAVIPCNEKEDLILEKNYPFLKNLKDGVNKGTIEIALHGLNHRKMTPYGEFKGLSYEEQYRRIKKGKALLDQVFNNSLVTFIPPFNSHDDNTSKALKANNIYIVSSSVYDVWSEAVFYPLSTSDFNQLDILVHDNQNFGGILVAMLHPYNFKDRDSFSNFEIVLKELTKNKEIHFDTFSGLEDKKIYVNNIQTEEQIKQNFLSKVFKIRFVFVSPIIILLIRVLNSLIYLIVLFSFYFLWQLIVLKKHHYNLFQYMVLGALGILIALSTYFCVWGPIKLFLIFILIFSSLPFVFRFFKPYDFKLKIHFEKTKKL